MIQNSWMLRINRIIQRSFSLGLLVTPLLASSASAADFSTGYQTLGGIVVREPGCATTADGTGDVTCAVVGTDNGLHAIRFNPIGGFTTGYSALDGVVVSSPGCASTVGGQVTCAAVGTNNGLFGIQFDPAL